MGSIDIATSGTGVEVGSGVGVGVGGTGVAAGGTGEGVAVGVAVALVQATTTTSTAASSEKTTDFWRNIPADPPALAGLSYSRKRTSARLITHHAGLFQSKDQSLSLYSVFFVL